MQRIADLFAISCSGLCAVHCFAAPAALVLVPLFGASVLDDEAFHLAILTLIVPASVLALLIGCLRHKDRATVTLGATGLGVIVLAALIGHELLGELGEKALTLAGSLILIGSHYRNFRLCRAAACAH